MVPAPDLKRGLYLEHGEEVNHMPLKRLSRGIPRITLLLLASSLGLIAACRAGSRIRGDTTAERTSLRHDGRERTYVVRVPDAVARRNTPVPLVIVLHGGGGNALNAESMTGFTAKANAEGFIVVYPDGTSRRGPLLTWNSGHCCGYAMQERVNDVAFLSALIDRLATDHPIDRRRVFVTGMSNGAMMSHRLGVELSEKVAAIAPVVGAVFGDEARPSRPVSALMINGMLDESVPYLGGASGGRFSGSWDGTPARPALDQARFWASANGCDVMLRSEDRGAFLKGQHTCPAPIKVEIYSVKDNGHAWPGGNRGTRLADAPSRSLNATDVIWEFFRTH
jgi:polyhydroxybutyrate depolymerase